MDFSRITAYLYIGNTPERRDQEHLKSLGVSLIINLRFERRPRSDGILPTIWLPTFDSPLIWIPVRLLKRGVDHAQPIIDNGGSVYVHCQAGIHRAAAMGCCILIANGYALESAAALVKEKRPKADPYAWYIHRQIAKFAKRFKPLTG